MTRRWRGEGNKFVRYADDIYVFVKSKRAGERVLESIRRYLERDLKLKINQGKSEVRNPSEIKILGFGLYAKKDEGYRIRIHPKSIEKIKEVVRKESRKTKAIKLEENKDTDKRDGQVGHQFIRSDKMEHDKAGSLEDMSQPDFMCDFNKEIFTGKRICGIYERIFQLWKGLMNRRTPNGTYGGVRGRPLK